MMNTNFSYCLSEHIQHENDAYIDPRLCFLLSAGLGTYWNPIEKVIVQHSPEIALSNSYIASTSGYALETFTNNCAHDFFMLHDYGLRSELEWLLSQIEQNDTHCLVKVSSLILDHEQETTDRLRTVPVWAIVGCKHGSPVNHQNPEKTLLTVRITPETSIDIEAGAFNQYWVVDHSDLNARRIDIKTTVNYENAEHYIKPLLETAFLRQFCALRQKSPYSNLNLLQRLKDRMEQNPTAAEIALHQELWKTSFTIAASRGETQMNRAYFAHCLEYLQELDLYQAPKTIQACHRAALEGWEVLEQLVNDASVATPDDFCRIYEKIHALETELIQHLKTELL